MAIRNMILSYCFFTIIFVGRNVVSGVSQEGETNNKPNFGNNRTPNIIPEDNIADVWISTGETKPSATDTLQLTVKLMNGTEVSLHLKLTEGILANPNTPVWEAKGESFENDNVTYVQNETIKWLSEFHFYQNYEYKVAVAVFESRMVGHIGYYEFRKNIQFSSSSSTPATGPKSSVSSSDKMQPSGKSNTLYLELLIIFDRNYVRADWRAAIETALAYWNSVDMLFSDIESPRIKLNIVGFVVPLNDYTTPWVNKTYLTSQGYIDKKAAVKALEKHINNHSREFPYNTYDFALSFVSTKIQHNEFDISGGGRMIPLTFHCGLGTRVGLINYIDDSYSKAAYELGRLLYLPPDDITPCYGDNAIMAPRSETSNANLLWSNCTRDFVKKIDPKEAMCLRNCPQTAPNCTEHYAETSKSGSVPNFIKQSIKNEVLLYSTISLCFWKFSTFF